MSILHMCFFFSNFCLWRKSCRTNWNSFYIKCTRRSKNINFLKDLPQITPKYVWCQFLRMNQHQVIILWNFITYRSISGQFHHKQEPNQNVQCQKTNYNMFYSLAGISAKTLYYDFLFSCAVWIFNRSDTFHFTI